jgi:hypothetical protein
MKSGVLYELPKEDAVGQGIFISVLFGIAAV